MSREIVYEKNKEYQGVTSRYQILRTIREGSSYYLETYNQVKVPESENDVYHIVSATEVNRLDLIANQYYGSPNYWWAIALANNFIDPLSVQEGTMIRIPSLTSLSDYKNEILTRR